MIPNSEAFTGSFAFKPDCTGSLRLARIGITSILAIAYGDMKFILYLTMLQKITRDNLTPVFVRRLEPVAQVKPGEIFLVETEDSRGGRTPVPEHTTPEYLLAMRKRGYHGNPVTGLIFVES